MTYSDVITSYLELIAINFCKRSNSWSFDFYPGKEFIVVFRFDKQPNNIWNWIYKYNHNTTSMAKCISRMLIDSQKFKLKYGKYTQIDKTLGGLERTETSGTHQECNQTEEPGKLSIRDSRND